MSQFWYTPTTEAGSNEGEAILSVTSEARRNAVSDVSWQPPTLEAGRVLAEQITEQQLQFEKDIDFSAETITPRVARESYGRLEKAHHYSSKVINCELAALQATEPSVGDGRVPVEFDVISSFSRQQNQSTVGRDPARNDRSLEGEQLAHVRTCRRTPATIRGDDEEIGGTGALLTGFQQYETLGVAASTYDSRADATWVEESQSCERLNEFQQYPQSAVALRVESVTIIKAKPIKQDHEAAESGEGVKKDVIASALRTESGGISLILLADTTILRTKRRRCMREIIFILCSSYRICRFYRKRTRIWQE